MSLCLSLFLYAFWLLLVPSIFASISLLPPFFFLSLFCHEIPCGLRLSFSLSLSLSLSLYPSPPLSFPSLTFSYLFVMKRHVEVETLFVRPVERTAGTLDPDLLNLLEVGPLNVEVHPSVPASWSVC